MDLVTFWRNYGRELEQVLDRAERAEAKRMSDVVMSGNHHLLQHERYAYEHLTTLNMIRAVVINMNRDEKIDGQKPKD